MSDNKPNAMVVVKTINAPEFQKKITESLPPGVSSDRFTRMTITALQTKPELLEADKDSLYLAILASAQTGIPPDGKKAALVVFNTKTKRDGKEVWVKRVQFMPMVSGIIDKLGEVGVSCDTEVVYEHDSFEYEAGDNPKIMHKPAKLGQDRGMMLGAYAILRKGTFTIREVMDTKQIEQVRAKSKNPDSLGWKDFTSEMYRKTVLRRGAKRVPMPLEDEDKVRGIIDADDETFNLGATETAEPVDQTVVSEQKQQPALEQTKGNTVNFELPKEMEKVPAKKDSARTSSSSTSPTSSAPARQESPRPSSSPASGSGTTDSSTKGPATNTPERAQPTRPRGLAAALASSSDSEDVF